MWFLSSAHVTDGALDLGATLPGQVSSNSDLGRWQIGQETMTVIGQMANPPSRSARDRRSRCVHDRARPGNGSGGWTGGQLRGSPFGRSAMDVSRVWSDNSLPGRLR